MVDVKNNHALFSSETVHFGSLFFIECELNQMVIPSTSKVISLSEAQKRLLLCLKNKMERKPDIIRVVWDDAYVRSRDNNYHQLVYQLRKLFQQNGLPDNIILTLPGYGLRINTSALCNQLAQSERGKGSSEPQNQRISLLERFLTITRFS